MLAIKLPKQTALGLVIALGLLTLLTFFYTISQWHQDWLLINQSPPKSIAISDNEADRVIASLPENHLFGQEAGNVPITSLQLRVTGIVKVDNEQGKEVSKAYISSAGAPSKIYEVGDSMPYGVKVHDITPDAVILENDGKLEKLPLPREPLAFKPRDETEP
jgi:type II secretory pathway component PulC